MSPFVQSQSIAILTLSKFINSNTLLQFNGYKTKDGRVELALDRFCLFRDIHDECPKFIT